MSFMAVLPPISKTAEVPEHAGIGFRSSQAEAARDVQRHLIAAVRKRRAARPAMAREHIEPARVLHDAVGLRGINLDDVEG